LLSELLRGELNLSIASITARTVTHNYFRSSSNLRVSEKLLKISRLTLINWCFFFFINMNVMIFFTMTVKKWVFLRWLQKN